MLNSELIKDFIVPKALLSENPGYLTTSCFETLKRPHLHNSHYLGSKEVLVIFELRMFEVKEILEKFEQSHHKTCFLHIRKQRRPHS